MIIHAAAQPSHDWAARDPFTDFDVNANGTPNLLEQTRHFARMLSSFCSTNKVYGDSPNQLPLLEHETRLGNRCSFTTFMPVLTKRCVLIRVCIRCLRV